MDLRQKLKKVLKREFGPLIPKSAPLDPEEKRQIINVRRNELARARKAGLAPPPVPRAKRNSQRFALEELTPENPPEGRTGVLEPGTTVPGESKAEQWWSGIKTPPTPGRSPEPEEPTGLPNPATLGDVVLPDYVDLDTPVVQPQIGAADVAEDIAILVLSALKTWTL